MTRILVQRGSASSSSGRASQNPANQPPASSREEEQQPESALTIDSPAEQCTTSESNASKTDESPPTEIETDETGPEKGKSCLEESPDLISPTKRDENIQDVEISGTSSVQIVSIASLPPPPPVPPPKPSNSSHIAPSSGRISSSTRPQTWPLASSRNSTSDLRPSSPRSFSDGEGYNSADEQNPRYGPSYDDERERRFELDIRRLKGYEVKRMMDDGNCLFRAVADQVYGDPEAFDMVRQMCIDYMERERDHFSQFITEGFASYCMRKRRDKVYGNNAEIQALSEMYNRPIHIYSYSMEPINIFHGGYGTDSPPIRLSYHRGNHYNSLIDPRGLTIGAGLGFNSLRGRSVDKDQVKAVIKAQQDQQIDNALMAEGRFYSDLELTEKEIERMVMEASRAEYLAHNDSKLKQHMGFRDSTPGAEPSSSAATANADVVGSECVRTLMGMGFGYLQVLEAQSIFGDDVDSILCFLLETDGPGSVSQGGAVAAVAAVVYQKGHLIEVSFTLEELDGAAGEARRRYEEFEEMKRRRKAERTRDEARVNLLFFLLACLFVVVIVLSRFFTRC